jgi:AAA ATPase domain
LLLMERGLHAPGPPGGLRGRTSECALLDGLVSALRHGESRSLLLQGEAGIGKTALLDHLVASASGLTVARAGAVVNIACNRRRRGSSAGAPGSVRAMTPGVAFTSVDGPIRDSNRRRTAPVPVAARDEQVTRRGFVSDLGAAIQGSCVGLLRIAVQNGSEQCVQLAAACRGFIGGVCGARPGRGQ